MNKKEKYRELCKITNEIPLFSKDWWLDIVCGKDNWDVCLVEKNNKVIATMPYYLTKKYGFKRIIMPTITQTMGPWIAPIQGKRNKILGTQKKIFQELINQLPSYDSFSQRWHHSQSNWITFYWNNFTQTTYYTYIIENTNDLELVWENLQSNIKTDIKKAKNRFNLEINETSDFKEFVELNKLTFNRQNIKVPYSECFIINLENTLKKKNCCKTFIAHDSNGKNHAGVFIVWDENTTYYLLGGGDPKYRNSGATSLCLWEAIKFSSNATNSFDFEGSMIEPIEKIFRAFGTKQVPYFEISKTNSKSLKCYKAIKSILN